MELGDIRRVVIIGAGHAGGAHALSLREQGFTGSITLLGEEAHAPYERPSLSKAMLSGTEKTALALAEAGHWAERFDLRLSTPAVALDRASREILLGNGTRLPYDAAVLATGGRARCLPGPACETVRTLRTVDDALALRRHAQTARSAVVIGGGVIGLEVAASLRGAGLSVTVLEAGPRILGRNVPAEVAGWMAALHAREGVEIITGAGIEGVEGMKGRVIVRLRGGATLEAELAVLGIGILPETKLAKAAGLPCREGVLVDRSYASLADPRVYAIGDLAEREEGGREGVGRQESWAHAQASARAAARAILGLPEEPEEVPWFWSDQFGHTLRVAGAPQAGEAVERGAQFRLYLRDRVVVGAACLDTARDFAIARRLIASRVRIDPGRAAEPATDLRKAVAA